MLSLACTDTPRSPPQQNAITNFRKLDWFIILSTLSIVGKRATDISRRDSQIARVNSSALTPSAISVSIPLP